MPTSVIWAARSPFESNPLRAHKAAPSGRITSYSYKGRIKVTRARSRVLVDDTADRRIPVDFQIEVPECRESISAFCVVSCPDLAEPTIPSRSPRSRYQIDAESWFLFPLHKDVARRGLGNQTVGILAEQEALRDGLLGRRFHDVDVRAVVAVTLLE